MTTIDDQIRGALDADDKEFLASLEADRGMFRQIGDSFSGPLGGWAKFSFAIAIAVGIGLAFSFYRAMTADGDAMLGWGLICLALLIMQGFLKEWMFARMNLLAVLREVKRLQLQVAMLDESQANTGPKA
ncbi:DUF6768 family protein [Pontixanthobacter aquaemixtae]|uniref:Uncharacterized protein n=1 Tax=Pontixanthobacter aquaemixtae TaxID=1958940 RepID=A0A844ZS02_9SPHN|nr:DUF6768 family protein [Pontixanthobacter aquaemixtae]MXO89587.1 hypothetical protein [Pontixanthobacter aquaemixtae]